MSEEEIDKKHIDQFTRKFAELIETDKLNIDSIESIMLENITSYEKELRHHVEEVLKTHIDEKSLVSKKTRMERKRIQINESRI